MGKIEDFWYRGNGGHAFPGGTASVGMSLLQYYAGQALIGIIQARNPTSRADWDKCAGDAFDAATAMIRKNLAVLDSLEALSKEIPKN